MMMLKFWARIIRGRWSKGRAAGVWRWAAVACACAVVASAQSFDALADRYRKTPTAATRSAVLRYAEAHRKDKDGALALLLLGATEDDERQFGDALVHLRAVADSGLRQFNDTEPALQPVWRFTPASPLVTKAALLQAESYLQGGNPSGAITLVEQHLADLP